MRYYYTYKITCLKGSLKGHYYYGQHTTDNLYDGYCGSGIIIKKYYKKYGVIENVTYIKEIISFYSNVTELNKAEYELIGDKYETDEYCLNVIPGGIGGINKKTSEETKKKQSNSHKGQASWIKGKNMPDSTKQKISEAMKGENNPMFGYVYSEETRQKMREAKKDFTPWIKGKNMPDSAKQKISEANKGRNKNKHWKINPETNKREWF